MENTERKRLRNVWLQMIARCHQPTHASFHGYGARGITVCERWRDLDAFLVDMGPRPQGHSIERLDNNLGYSPSNCVWATPKQQAQNRRLTGRITCDGERITYREASRRTGIGESTIRARLRMGWDHERTLQEIPTFSRTRRFLRKAA